MSETLAEEEKQRIRVELITEIAKNEQDLEQCNEETGRYGREFLYNIRDLEQLCSITECPLTSHELKEFGIFPKKKNLLNRAWTHVKEIVTKPHKAEEEAARSAREKAEFEERMNSFAEQLRREQEEFAEQFRIMKTFLDDLLRRSEDAIHERERIMMEEAERQKGEVAERFKIIEEQMRRSDEARIEMEVSVKELAERHNREEERYNREKAELVERIKMMEEQMRRSDEARIEMERWIEEEKDRKIKEEEEKRFREEEARIEKERAETEERERKEEENRCIRLRETSASKIQNYYRGWRLIVKAREELNERRIEADVKSLLALPNELRVQSYRDFNLEKRRELRINEELAEIELKTEYRCERLEIERKEDYVELSNLIRSDEEWEICDEVFIPISEIEKELEIMGKNTQFDIIRYAGAKSEDRQIINGFKSLKAKKLIVDENSSLNEFDLRSIAKNREQVYILSNSAVTLNVLMWIYENMRDGQFELNKTTFYVLEEVRWSFLDKFGNFNRESLIFTETNPNQKVREEDDGVIIEQGNLTMYVKKTNDVGCLGLVRFRFDC